MKKSCFGRLILFFVVVLNWTNISSQNAYYVAVDGSPSGKGTIDDPLDVWSAFDSYHQLTPMTPGDTLYFREGVYEGVNFGIGFSGTKDEPCIVKPYNHETVVFRGIIELGTGMAVFRNNGHYVHVYDMIITCAAQDRITNVAGSYPDIPNATGGYVTGSGGKFINCIFHNNSKTGINSTSTAVDAEIYGNIIFNNGWVETPDGGAVDGHGHGLYFQNSDGRKIIENNIIFNQFGYGIQFYSEGGTGTTGSDVIDNVVFKSGIWKAPETGDAGTYNYLIESNEGTFLNRNFSYHRNGGGAFNVGYSKTGNDIDFINNYCFNGGGIVYKNFKQVHARNNTVVINNRASNKYPLSIAQLWEPSGGPYTYDIDSTWIYTNNGTYPYVGTQLSDWQNKWGVDKNATETRGIDFEKSNNSEINTFIKVVKNKYEDKRAYITIANHKLLDLVYVDVSEVLKNGDEYWLYDVEDLREPIEHGKYNGSLLGIATNQKNVFPVIGTEVYCQPSHSTDDFGVYILLGRELRINIAEPRDLVIDSLTSKSWIEEDKVYEDIGAYYTLEEDAEVSLTILNNRLSPVLTISDYQSGSLVDMPDTCKTGNYVLRVNTSSAADEKGFSFKPLTLFTSDTTICNELGLSYYSPVNDSIRLNIRESSGNLLLDSLIYSAKGVDSLYMDLSGITDGSYSAKLTYSKRETSEILIEKNSCDSLKIISCEPESTYRLTTISYVSPNTDSVSVNLKNAQGISVLDSVLIGPKGEQLYRDINLWGLNPGTYQLVLDDHISESVWPDSIEKLRPLEILSYEDSTYNVCTLEYYAPLSESVLIKIMTLNGAFVDSLTDTSVFGVNKVDVDLTGFDAAKYIIKLIDNISSDSCVVTKLAELNILDYTNNVTDTLSINYFSPKETNVTLDVLDSSGGAVIEPVKQGAVIGNNVIEIDLRTLKEGDYTFILFDGTTSLERSFTKLSPEVPYEFEISSYTGSVIDTLTVEYYTSRDTTIVLAVYYGNQVVVSSSQQSEVGENLIRIDFESFAEGSYTFVLSDGITEIQREFYKQGESIPGGQLEISGYTEEVSNYLVVDYFSPGNNKVVLEVINSFGEIMVESIEQDAIIGSNTIQADLTDLEAGSYKFILSDGITTLEEEFKKLDSETSCEFKLISLGPKETVDQISVTFLASQDGNIEIDIYHIDGNPDFEVLIRQIISVKECEQRTVVINLEGRLDSSNSYFLKLREVNTGKEQKDTFSIE